MAGPSPKPSPDPRLISLLRQATALREAGNLPETLKMLRQAALIAPSNADLQHDLGVTCLTMGDREAALRHFDRAIALDPRMGLAHFRRGVALELLGRAGFAEATLKDANGVLYASATSTLLVFDR